jgi:hypothetical protein
MVRQPGKEEQALGHTCQLGKYALCVVNINGLRENEIDCALASVPQLICGQKENEYV